MPGIVMPSIVMRRVVKGERQGAQHSSEPVTVTLKEDEALLSIWKRALERWFNLTFPDDRKHAMVSGLSQTMSCYQC